MIFNSLRTQVVGLSIGLVLVISFASLVNFWWTTSQFNELEQARDIEAASQVYQQYLALRESQLLTSARVLTADFGFKQAVATRDEATIQSVLQNHANRINADLMLLTDLSGKLVSSTLNSKVSAGAVSAFFSAQGNRQGQAGLMSVDNRLYQAVILPIKAPRAIAYALIGFELSHAKAVELKSLTNMEVTFVVDNGRLIVSSLDAEPAASLTVLKQAEIEGWFSHSPLYQTRYIPIDAGGQEQIEMLISANLQSYFDGIKQLTRNMAMLVLLTLLFGAAAASVLASNMTSPVLRLVKLAREFASGDYSHKLEEAEPVREIAVLEKAFEEMGRNIQNREEQISYQATHDELTGLLNRHALSEFLEAFIGQHERLVMMVIDVKRLRNINDKLGPQIGDECLQLIAQRIAEFSKENNGECARIGDDEFVALFPYQAQEPRSKGELSLIARLMAPYHLSGLRLSLRFSTGVVLSPQNAETAGDLLRRGLIAMEQAATSDREMYYYQNGEDEAHLTSLRLVDDLQDALTRDDGELFMLYQPKQHLASGAVTKAEALIRWRRSDGEFVNPELFIELAEQAGLIVELTHWVIKTVVAQVRSWLDLGVELQVSINVSAQDINHPNFQYFLTKVLTGYEVPPEMLTIELTERDMMEDEEKGIAALKSLKKIGLKVALDDYGIGQTSLGKLKTLPVDQLKLDKCFILTLDESEKDQCIVESTIQLGHRLGFSVIAEGVENQASRALLSEMGCDFIQGYYLARPLAPDDLIDWLKEHCYANG